MKLNPKFLTHETKGEHITVSTTGTKFNGLIRSNPTAAFIVESLKTDTTESAVVDKMLAKCPLGWRAKKSGSGREFDYYRDYENVHKLD